MSCKFPEFGGTAEDMFKDEIMQMLHMFARTFVEYQQTKLQIGKSPAIQRANVYKTIFNLFTILGLPETYTKLSASDKGSLPNLQ